MTGTMPKRLMLGLGLALGCSGIPAHPLDPALLELQESVAGTVEVLWRLPLSPEFPERCRSMSAPSAAEVGQSVIQRWRMDCGSGSLAGERIGVAGLDIRKTDALVRIRLAEGRLIQAVLRGDSPSFEVPRRASPWDVMLAYLKLGLEHILTGFDHLLFVLGLILLVHHWRPLLWTITAFTAGHSVTLTLAAMGLVHVPQAPIEALIALSLDIS